MFEMFKELRWTLEANISPLEKQLGTLLIWFIVVFPGKKIRLLSWKTVKKNFQTFGGTSRT